MTRSITTLLTCTFFATLLTSAASLAATPKGPYQPMGAPADPKVPVSWNRYHDYAEATAILKQLVAAHPERARLESLGKSCDDRDMWVLTITSSATGDDRSKPAFWIDGAIHANEIQATQVSIYTGWYLLEMYDRVPWITRLVDERTFYIVPMMSPDSRDAHMYEANTTHSPRSGQWPVDDDRDGLVNEDPADDLDGDGHITRMRVRDPNGRYKEDPKYPNLMIEAEPNEKGEYRLLGSEGYDNDEDGRINEDGDGYYDPNRDWAWGWQPKYVQYGAYRYPFSVIENRLVADFVLDHPNIAGAQSYHNTGGMILRGPGTEEEVYPAADLEVYKAIAEKGEMMLPGYDYIDLGGGLYAVYGGELEWFFSMRGIFTYSNELFTGFNFFRKPSGDGWMSKREDQEAFNKYLLFEQGSVAWHEVDHPQYGKIEVGGLKKQWVRQPPSFLLEEECHRNMAFTLYHADQMPMVKVQSVKTKKLDADLTEVTAVISNERLTPTHAALDLQRKLTPPNVVRIQGDSAEVVLGLISNDSFFTRAREQKRNPAELRIANIPGMGAVHVRWLIRGQGPFTVEVESPKGGSDSK